MNDFLSCAQHSAASKILSSFLAELYRTKSLSYKYFFPRFVSFVFNSEEVIFEYFGVYYKEIMYYLSTDPGINVVQHILEMGNKNRVIANSRIPNEHRIPTITMKIQGHSLKNFVFNL